MMGLAIWTFDLVQRVVPQGSDLPALGPDVVLFEDCHPSMTLEQATERALHLAMKNGGVYFVRSLNEHGVWSPPTKQQWRDGVAHVAKTQREQAAREKRKRQLKKMKVYYE